VPALVYENDGPIRGATRSNEPAEEVYRSTDEVHPTARDQEPGRSGFLLRSDGRDTRDE
jgi:hypothetical protein